MARRRRKKLPQEPVRCTIESTSHDGRGVTHIDGKTIFVEGALAGEEVSFQYTEKRSKFDEGRTLEVQQASDKRVEPDCAHASICGGCSLQHLHTDAQVSLKQDVLLEQLKHFGGLAPETLLEPMRSPTQGYRRKARLAVKFVPKKGGAMVGFREKRSPFVADIESCTVLVPEVGGIIPQFRELISGLDCHRTLPQIEVAQGDDATALVFRHLEPLSESDQSALLAFCQAQNLQLYLQPGGNDTVHRVWPEEGEERLSYRLDDFGVELKFHPMDFTQVNPFINRAMVSRAIEFLELAPTDRVLDLFCGLGNFTLPIATKTQHVVGVEGGEAMVVRGKENAAFNQLDNVEFFGADLTQPFEDQPWANLSGSNGFNKILIDPPRSGALEIVQKMTVFKPERIVYVSCNPATLARDAGELVQQGYRLTKAGIMDMFPHTTHVESIAVFEPAK
ncbi:MAG: 23S rRNA (uracil(1939)-C(5))-methyltransferase RlmD [Pseudomonadales bacterium]|nr:23S rRNA (uracil(1939)-C(5))-methyltransferase RlmD [Pseudomonadales bacterium]